MDASAFEQLLAGEIGLEVMSLGPAAVADAVKRRMAVCSLANEVDYYARLVAVPDELQALVDLVVVSETWFFRDREPFEFLARFVQTEWAPAHADRQLRVLSMPCSTGEEAYSIGITLRAAGLGPSRYQIDAVDISHVFLRKAEAGVYGWNSFRGAPQDGDPRYFLPEKDGFSVRPEVREGIRFLRRNFFRSEGLPPSVAYEVIFCRNLLIYQHEAARRQIIGSLDRRLAANGLLFVGHAEMLSCFPKHYQPVRHNGAFAYRKTVPQPEPAPPMTPNRTTAHCQAPAVGSAEGNAEPGGGVRAAGEDQRRSLAATSVQAVVAQARSLADLGRLDEAAAVCEAALKQQVQDAGIYFLLGLIRERHGQIDAAEDLLNRALYLNEHFYDALVHLALLKASRGDASAAEGLRRRAARVHERQATGS